MDKERIMTAVEDALISVDETQEETYAAAQMLRDEAKSSPSLSCLAPDAALAHNKVVQARKLWEDVERRMKVIASWDSHEYVKGG